MKKFITFSLLLTFIFLQNFNVSMQAEVSYAGRQIINAYKLLNKIRKNPAKYSRFVGVDLSGVKPRPPLKWNKILFKSALTKARDMARRNYFDHVNPDGIGPNYLARKFGYVFPRYWSKKKSANNIESISAGLPTGEGHIRNLLNDNGASHRNAGHRLHLLGMKSFYAKHIHVGIGFTYNPGSRYRYYFVVHTGVPGR